MYANSLNYVIINVSNGNERTTSSDHNQAWTDSTISVYLRPGLYINDYIYKQQLHVQLQRVFKWLLGMWMLRRYCKRTLSNKGAYLLWGIFYTNTKKDLIASLFLFSLVLLWTHVGIRSWCQPVPSYKSKVSCSCKQRWQLTGMNSHRNWDLWAICDNQIDV